MYIYALKNGKWELEHELAEHDMGVTSVDWGEKMGKIVTCSHDRNAYVWEYEEKSKTWKPGLVLLRINRSATCVRFCPNENKFAVGTGAKLISICYYDEKNNWWISRHIKKSIEGTITSVSWHPSGVIVGASCTDMKIYIFSARVKEIDSNIPSTQWGKDTEFGSLLYSCESENRGWMHSLSFSPSGDAIAWACHDSSVSYKSVTSDKYAILYTKVLPFRTVAFISETVFLAAGYDLFINVYQIHNNKIILIGSLGSLTKSGKSNQNSTAFKIFKMLDTRAQKEEDSDTKIEATVHKNTISTIRNFSSSGSLVTKISSTADDGNLVIWDVSKFLDSVPNVAFA